MLVEEFIELAKKICVQKSEEQTVELKAAHIDCPKRLYDTLSSFSNQDSGGILIFGIDEKDEIKPESLAAGWQTSGTTKLTRFAYNLWNGYDDKSCTPYDLFDCSFAPYMYEAVKLRYPEYTRQLDDMVIDDVRN